MILELIQKGNVKAVHDALKSQRKVNVEAHKKEYDGDRSIRATQVGKRQDKKNGDKVAKISIPFQKKIVKDASAFLFGSPVKLVPNENNDSSQKILDLWNKTRIDAMLLKFCKTVKSESEGAIIFQVVDKDGEPTIKSRLLSNKNGVLYPYFDAFGDMIAFGWEFKSKENGKDVLNLYLFTEDKIRLYKQISGDWALVDDKVNFFQKIPVVYLSQDNPEWKDVEGLIDRFEMSFSKFCDTNDYFAAPIFKVKGSAETPPKKDETGRVISLDIVETPEGNIISSDAEFLTWEHAPESTKLEFQTTKELIYGLSSTPDLTLEAVKGIGQIANAGMKLMFLAPILKAKEAEGDYRTAIERIISIMKAGLINVLKDGSTEMEELIFDIQFTSVLPENLKEIVEILTEANGGKSIMSQKSTVAINPLIENVDNEMEMMKQEESEEAILDLGESAI